MTDYTASERNLGIILAACMMSLFVLAAWQSQRMFDMQAKYWEQRTQVNHMLDRCVAAPDGSGTCKAATFVVPATTTTLLQGPSTTVGMRSK